MSSPEGIRADVVVVGAGIMGSSIGFHLARDTGLDVIVVDERPPVGGISGRTFGQIRQHYSNALLVDMARYGFNYLKAWDVEVGVGNPGYARFGYLLLVTGEQLEACRQNVELGQSRGVDTRLLGPDEIRTVEPLLVTDDLAGGAYEPDGGYIDVTKMVMSWLLAGERLGMRLATASRVETLATAAGAVTGVRTKDHMIEAPIVVAATGAWANELLDPIGASVPIEKRRLDMAVLSQPGGRSSLNTCVTDGNSNLVLRPDMGARMVAVAYPPTMPLVDDPLDGPDETEHQEHLRRLRHALEERLPEYNDAEVVASISGAYDVTPDYHPILGWSPDVEGLYLATGFSGHGLKLSPSVGAVVSSAVAGRASPFDINQLRPARFADGDLMAGVYGNSARA